MCSRWLYNVFKMAMNGVGICPGASERQTIIVSICNVECAFEPRGVVIYYILLVAIGAVIGVFAYYPHPGGQA